ncbi:hypothetical protein DWZ54_02835 [Mitsuokella sp. AF33-22]|uniref:hypothetical protein n=1 Tax=Mitsuokella sp. AF33-22 TaxID=2292047 RepID=UPI000E4F68A2|nr:hypothetical protein [Mitsuokella sp. AF33-22]RHM56795.1 hypothetical protein DWZ54_02835 [Mitsuokella sp. AF33-22]
MANEPSRITDNLLNVFNYCFVETVPYAFFKPNPERDIAVNLVDKEYHCPGCGKVTRVVYQKRPLTYYSKGKLAEERRIYDKLGKEFPFMGEIYAGKPFTNEAIGYCRACAGQEILKSEEPGQRVANLSLQLHGEDELVVAKARAAMEQSLKDWLAGVEKPEDFLQYQLTDFAALRDFICAVMLEDTQAVSQTLADYRTKIAALEAEIRALLSELPDTWRAYAARSTGVYESMNDKMYHEYTVAFPQPGTMPEDYYIYRQLEKSRVLMFLEQPRIETIEELLMEVGFHGEWIDLVNQRIQQLLPEA